MSMNEERKKKKEELIEKVRAFNSEEDLIKFIRGKDIHTKRGVSLLYFSEKFYPNLLKKLEEYPESMC